MQRNIYLSWSTAYTKLVPDLSRSTAYTNFAPDVAYWNFVEQWRLAISSDFKRCHVGTVANNVLRRCSRGKNYSGLDPKKGECRNGVWVKEGLLGPKVTSKNVIPEKHEFGSYPLRKISSLPSMASNTTVFSSVFCKIHFEKIFCEVFYLKSKYQ